MKRYSFIIFTVLLVVLMTGLAFAEKGPLPDKVYWDVRMKQEIGIKDTAEGNTDLFFYGVDAPKIMALNDDTKRDLDVYNIPASSWALSVNPIPDEEPYTWEVDGEEKFNPFAIRKIRFALNFLINRQYLVDELLNGAGGPMYSAITPVAPNTYKYNLLAASMGFISDGDEQKALNDIEQAMQKAAEISHNKGRLKKDGEWWTYDGEPVTIKIIMRADDPSGRLKVGEYVAQQIEKAGIKVEKLAWERTKAIQSWLYGDPADYEWHLYTDGWLAGGTYKFHDQNLAQMYAPWFGFMPGGSETDEWSYKHDELNRVTQQLYQGKFTTEDEYWDLVMEATELGLEESCRVYLAYSNVAYVANDGRFQNRMAYGLGDGLNKWSLVTANTIDNVLNATQFSAKGSLFMDAWDPVGTNGFSGVYSNNIASALSDYPVFAKPSTAEWIGNAVKVLDAETKVYKNEEGKLVGEIEVPENAIEYDPVAEKWVEVGEGLTAYTRGEYEIKPGVFHHGIPLTIIDYMYADAFVEEWITKDNDDDPYYDKQYAEYMTPGSEVGKGTIYNLENNKVVNYFDSAFPPDEQYNACNGAPNWTVTGSGHYVGVSWEIVEALVRLVVNGGESGENYAFASGVEGAVEVDVIRPTCVEDIKVALNELKEEGFVPTSISEYVTEEEAIARYEAALDFIDEYGHAYISNGPFYLSDYQPDNNFIELSAFRHEDYYYSAEEMLDKFRTELLVVNKVNAPLLVNAGEEFDVSVYVSQITYPDNEEVAVNKGNVELIFIKGDKEVKVETEQIIQGMFLGTIPGEVTNDLEPGTYTLVSIASKEEAIPSSEPISIVVQ